MTRWLPVLALALGVLAAPAAAAVPVASLTLDGAITPITVRLVELALAQAQADGASALLVRLDTPGGLERSTRSIVQRMLAAEIPVVVYVSPTGARAASAGVFITMAAHVAAMAPATNIGAAHPVTLGGGQPDEESVRKLTNDTAAFARTIAAAASSSLDVKCLYRLALAMPTSLATSSTVIRSKPFSASRRLTDATIASSRARSTCSRNETRAIPRF